MEDLNRNRILQAANELFNNRGYKNVSISDLAEKLGMSKKTIYQYFSGKKEIAAAVIEDVMSRISKKFDSLEPGLDPLSQIRATFEQVKAEVSNVSPLFQEDIHKYLPDVYKRIKEIRGDKIQMVERCIRAAQQMGQAKSTIDARLATIVFLEAVQGFNRPELARQGFSKFEAIDALIDIFISGIQSYPH